jgi:hypothetical protein
MSLMSEQNNPYYQAYLREKRARVEVEILLENSTRQLYEKNQQLQQQITHWHKQHNNNNNCNNVESTQQQQTQ